MRYASRLILAGMALFMVWGWAAHAQQAAPVALDLAGAVIVTPGSDPVVAKAVDLLQGEVAKRTGVRLKQAGSLPEKGASAIVLATASEGGPAAPDGLEVPGKPDGYAIWVDGATVCLVGHDARGALFAAGRLLRLLDLRPGLVALDGATRLATAPRYLIRGHELGYRNTSNTYDKWDVADYEQYIRDLIVFGVNSVQLIPEIDPDEMDSDHMSMKMFDMSVALSDLIASYGLEVWFWLPLLDDVATPEAAKDAFEKRRVLFEACSRIDAVFVPGGDPGHTEPQVLLPWLREMAAVLRESHPEAEVWLSNEGFEPSWNDLLFEELEREPEWLDGLVFGTWVKIPITEERARTPERYPIVQYCDITHCKESQYPVSEWDRAFALTCGREPINPRPVAMKEIHEVTAPYSVGFNTYSDGVNDDVNKIVWSVLGWDPDADVRAILEEYGRYFMGVPYADRVADGLLALERNWEGALLDNTGVEETLALWQSLEAEGGQTLRENWRFQMALLRATFDAYVQRRLSFETELEQQARDQLREARDVGVADAVAAARATLARARAESAAPALRARLEELGRALFTSIGMQLDVKNYGAKNWERGAILVALDQPLNDRVWLEREMTALLTRTIDEEDRLALLGAVLNWEDPGPGGFYDDLGNISKQPHLVRQKSFAEDPGFVKSSQNEHMGIMTRSDLVPSVEIYRPWRLAWADQGQTLFYAPLQMHYDGLDPEASYALEVVYTGRFRPTMRLMADGIYPIHDYLPQPPHPTRLRFDIPRDATGDGVLDLEWQKVNGRGCQVAEVWLVRK